MHRPVFLLSAFICVFSLDFHKLPDVEKYEVVKPLRLNNARTKRSLSSKQSLYPDELQYALTVEGRNYTINLEKNRNLLGKDYTETHYLKNGTEVTYSPKIKDHCYYQGHIEYMDDSSVSVEVCSGIRGFLRAEQKVFLIEPLNGSLDGQHAVYRQEHLRMKRSICKESNRTFFDHGPKVSGLFKSGSWISAPLAEGQRYVEMFLVVDNAEYQKYQGNMQTVRTRMLEVVNHVDKLYRPVKIRVMLVGLEIWSNRDKIVVSTDPDETLTRFLEWRKTELLKKKKHDNAHFVTGVNFDGSTVGLANKFAMCTVNSGAVNEDHNRNPIGLASTIAHEMGHNLGMSHDSEDCMCETAKSSKRCIMADSVGEVYPQSFSSCSRNDLNKYLGSMQFDPRCLLNIPSPDDLYGGPQCGNDFLEPGEECDCGSPEECRNPCCNATTCRLKEGVQCAQGECCQNCKIRQVGHLCRESAQECDLPEYCTGQSPDCPKDDFKMNGLPCNQGYCYNGKCPTHLKHCQTLWGSDANVAASQCFRQNTEGNEHLYCKQFGNSYQGCAEKDVKCGKIHCNGGNPFPITQRKYTIRLWGEQCNVADIIEGETEDLGLVPTGTKCGENKVCIDSVCRDIEVYRTKNCSAKCNNHGVCNHERECHCDPGWEPPYCNESRNVPRGGNAMIIGVSVAVMILILLPIIIGGIMCCRGNKKDDYSSEKKANVGSGLSNPLFQEGNGKGSPRCGTPKISRPTLLETSATPLVVTVIPSRQPPKPPVKKTGEESFTKSAQVVKPSNPPPAPPTKPQYTQVKPLPPSKPLPELNVTQLRKPNPLPPIPPVKPAGSTPHWNQKQAAGRQKVALMPPVKPR